MHLDTKFPNTKNLTCQPFLRVRFALSFRACYLLMIQIASLQIISAQPSETIQIGPDFIAQNINANTWHRVGAIFEPYDTQPQNWDYHTLTTGRLAPDLKHWLYASLENTGNVDRTLKLLLHNVQIDTAILYHVLDGQLDTLGITGSLIPSRLRATTDRTLSIPLTMPSGRKMDMYLCVWRKEYAMTLNLSLLDPAKTADAIWVEDVLFVVIGLTILILLVSILLTIYFPTSENYWFLFYIFFGNLYLIAAMGHGSLYLWPSAPWFEENAAIFLGALNATGFFQFSRKVLRLKEVFPKLNATILLFSIVYILIANAGFGVYFNWYSPGSYAHCLSIIYIGAVICLAIIFGQAMRKAIVQGQKEYWWFVSIFIFHLYFVGMTIAFEIGWLHYNHIIHAIMMACTVPPQMLLTIAFLIIRMISTVQYQQKKEILLQHQIQKERFRFSRELHDNVGSELSSIKMSIERLLGKMNKKNTDSRISMEPMLKSAASAIALVQDLEWGTNPKNEDGENLVSRIRDIAYKHMESFDLEINIHADEAVDSLHLPPLNRHQIILLFKESLNNILKHAQATQVEVRLFLVEKTFWMSICDNGIGFDIQRVSKGNGLENMRKRCEELGGTFTCTSVEGRGTKIKISIPS